MPLPVALHKERGQVRKSALKSHTDITRCANGHKSVRPFPHYSSAILSSSTSIPCPFRNPFLFNFYPLSFLSTTYSASHTPPSPPPLPPPSRSPPNSCTHTAPSRFLFPSSEHSTRVSPLPPLPQPVQRRWACLTAQRWPLTRGLSGRLSLVAPHCQEGE